MAEKTDFKENEMLGGVPARIRALDADGNSISPTLPEVVSTMPIATDVSNGMMPSGLIPSYNIEEKNAYNVVFKAQNVSVGLVLISLGTQDSNYTYCDFLMHIRTNNGSVGIKIANLTGANIPTIYYKVDGNYVLFAIKNISEWTHVNSVSFCRRIASVSQKITSIVGWTNLI